MDQIGKVTTREELKALMVRFLKNGSPVPFGVTSLPEREYYFRDEDRTKKIRDEFVAHVDRTLQLGGVSVSGAPDEDHRGAAGSLQPLQQNGAGGIERAFAEFDDHVP